MKVDDKCSLTGSASASKNDGCSQTGCAPKTYLRTARKGTVSATKAAETQGKGSVLATQAVETQGRGSVLLAHPVMPDRRAGREDQRVVGRPLKTARKGTAVSYDSDEDCGITRRRQCLTERSGRKKQKSATEPPRPRTAARMSSILLIGEPFTCSTMLPIRIPAFMAGGGSPPLT